MRLRRFVVALFGIFVTYAAMAQEVPLRNWAVDTNWPLRQTRTEGVKTIQGLVATPVVFQALDPCRMVDTRNANGTFGGPAFSNGTTRSFPFAGNSFCSFTLPGSIVAYSLNFTLLNNNASGGFLTAFPTGATLPSVSNLNWITTDTQRGNFAIVPANGSGSINVFTNVSVGTVHLIIDINGIFVSTLPGTSPLAITSTGSQSAVSGTNSSASAGAYGLFGQATGNGASAAGVRGVASGTGAGSAGVSGVASQTGASGVLYGVLGQTGSTSADSAGVRGFDGTGAPPGATSFPGAGVRGESTSAVGVLGMSQASAIRGSLLNGSGSAVAEGFLGYATGGNNYGVYAVGDIGATGTKFFVTPHPSDPSQVIRYVALEGPEVGTYCRGRAQLQGRLASIDLPESFRAVTEDEGLSVQITPIGSPASLWIESVGTDRIVVRGPRDVEFFYSVNGVRKGFAGFQAVAVGNEFVPESAQARIPEGLNPEARKRLIANGTYNKDGTVNLETARRLGWMELWQRTSATGGPSPDRKQ